VLVDTRQDLFMIRISDVEFLPPERIDPDNPPPWISTEYILRPAWLPLPLNATVSLEQGTTVPLHLRALQLDLARRRPLLLSLNTSTLPPHGGSAVADIAELWLPADRGCVVPSSLSSSSSTFSPSCCARQDCARVNLCSDCSDQCRLLEILESLQYRAAPVCSLSGALGPVSSTPAKLKQVSVSLQLCDKVVCVCV